MLSELINSLLSTIKDYNSVLNQTFLKAKMNFCNFITVCFLCAKHVFL